MDSNQDCRHQNQREVRRLRPIVEQIVSIEESWNGKGQEFLLEKTREWQGYLHRFLPMDLPPVRIVEAAPREELEEIAAKLNARFESLKSEFASLPAVEATPASIEEGKAAWNNITPQFDKLRERYLNQILPESLRRRQTRRPPALRGRTRYLRSKTGLGHGPL